MANRTRPIILRLAVTENEKRLIEKKMEQLGTKNFGAYARKMLIDGYIIKVDYTQQKKLAAAVSRAASNINQICRRINSKGNLYEDDVAELKELGVELHTSNELFRPDAQVTRAEFAAMLYTTLERSGALPEVPTPTPTPTPTPEATAVPTTTAVPEESPEATATPEVSPEATAAPEESPAASTAPQESEPPATEETKAPISEAQAPNFTDIQGHWAQDYIQKSAQLGLVSGVTDTTFAPDKTITRQEMMVMIDRVLELPEVNGLGFSDDGDIALWALESAARTTAAGIFQGSGGKLLPKAAATRAEAATVLAEVLDYAA